MEYHWPFAVCILLVSSFAVAAILLLRKFEGVKFSGKDEIEDPSVIGVTPIGYLSRVELWSACGGGLNPSYLLVFRALCVLYLLPILIYNVVLKGGGVFFFYTECTFTLLIVYFALAFRQSLLHYLEDRSSESRIIPRESITNHHDRLLNEDVEASSNGALSNGVEKAVYAPLREIQEGAGVEGYLIVLDKTNWRTNLLTAILVPYLALQLPEPIFGYLRGGIGAWIAFIAVVIRLFFAQKFPDLIHGDLEFPVAFILLIVTAPHLIVHTRGHLISDIVCLIIGAYLLFEHISHEGGFRRAFAETHGILHTIGILLLFVAPAYLFFKHI